MEQSKKLKELMEALKKLEEDLKLKNAFIKELQEDNRELRKGINKEALDYFLEKTQNTTKEEPAEKDKEIAKHISALEYNENNLPNQKKAIRRRLCNEIKTLIAKEYGIAVEDMPKHYHRLAYSVEEIYKLLDKIEEGEEK